MQDTRRCHPNGDSYCFECKKIRYEKFKNNPDNKEVIKKYHRVSFIKRTYGLTEKQYNELWESQNDSCAICKTKEKSSRKFHIDHCHKTNEIRGILCHYCNTALGLCKDNTDILQNAINYLRSDTMKKAVAKKAAKAPAAKKGTGQKTAKEIMHKPSKKPKAGKY
jgi:hypothetical protein